MLPREALAQAIDYASDIADWSIDSTDIESFTQSNPTTFKTLNLTKTISILNAVSTDTFNKTLVASVAIDFNLTK